MTTGERRHIKDAVFYEVAVEDELLRPSIAPGRPLSPALLLVPCAYRQVRVRSAHCILTRLSRPHELYVCTPPPDPLASCSPAIVFAARGVVAEWSFCGPPAPLRLMGGGAAQKVCDHIKAVAAIDWMRTHYFEPITCADELEPRFPFVLAGLGYIEDQPAQPPPVCAASVDALLTRNTARLLMGQYLPLHAAEALTLHQLDDRTYMECMVALSDAGTSAPWRLFAEGVIDSLGLQSFTTLGELRPTYDSATWQTLARAYAMLQELSARFSEAALPLAPDLPAVAELESLGLLRRRASDNYFVLTLVERSAAWLRGFCAWLQALRVPESAAPASQHEPLATLLRTRDILFLETALPLAATAAGVARPAELQSMAKLAAMVLVPRTDAAQMHAVQEQFVQNMNAAASADAPTHLPLVVVEDLQLWSHHALWFWLAALLHASQASTAFETNAATGRFANTTGSCAPFKLLLCYANSGDDVGACRLLLGQAAMPAAYVASLDGVGFPPPTMGACERSVAASLLYGLARDRSRHDAARLRNEIVQRHLGQVSDTGREPTAVARRHELAADVPIVDAGADVCALRQLRLQGCVPLQMWNSSGTGLRMVRAVALANGIDVPKFVTLLCVCTKVILIIE